MPETEPWTDQEILAQEQYIGLPQPDYNEKIDQLETVMEQVSGSVLNIEPVHRFLPGVYMREVTIPAGTLLTSRLHKTRHACIVSKGSITVWSNHEGVQRISAPATFISEPGVRRVGYAHEDTVWSNVHSIDGEDIPTIEDALYAKRGPVTDTTLGEEILGQLVGYLIPENNKWLE